MRFFWLSKGKKECPEPPGGLDYPALFEEVQGMQEVIQSLTGDMATVNTAIARIERKQNRWIEILNERAGGDGSTLLAALTSEVRQPPATPGFNPGDEEED